MPIWLLACKRDAFRIFFQFISSNFSQKWLHPKLNKFIANLIKIRAIVEYRFVGNQSNRGSKIFCPNISPSLKWPVVKNDILEPEWICQNAIKIDQMIHQMTGNRFRLETVQDCLIKLGIKPQMHRLEKSIFSLNNDLVRLTKITLSKISKFWVSKSFFSVKNWSNLSKKYYLWRIFH